MYVKFFSNKKGGSIASIKYLLNDREREGTARTIKGNPELTKQIINSITRKQKATVGVLSFEEAEPLTEKQKHEIIEEFEKVLLPGLDQEQYNILWVEHTDKGRLELNFVIPKMELTTQKALQPYYHKQDFSRIEMFEDISNIKYNLSSKKDPSKNQALQGSKKDINLVKDYQELDKTLLGLVAAQQLRSREQLIETVKESGIEVTRAGKDYLSLKLPESKKARKFKGGIYAEQFRSLESIEDISREAEQRAREFHQRDTQAELRAISKRLDRYNRKKAQQNREKYKLNNGKYSRSEQEPIQSKSDDMDKHINSDNISLDRSSNSGLHPEAPRPNYVASTKRDEIRGQGGQVYQEPRDLSKPRSENNLYQDRGINDSIRTAIERRARAREAALTEARNPIIYQSRGLQQELERDKERIQRSLERYEDIVGEVVTERYQLLYQEAQRVVQQRKRQQRLRKRLGETINSIRDKFEQFTNSIRNRLFAIGGKLTENEEQSASLAQAVREYKKELEREEEPDYSYSMRMR